MKTIIKSIAFASLALTLLLSCAREEIGGPELEDGQMELTVTGVLGEYEAADDTKASLVNTLRVEWTQGDQVHVFQKSNGTYLGALTADNGGKVATLTGTLTSGSGEMVFVYTNATVPAMTAGTTQKTSLDINLASQGAATPFVVYGTATPGTTKPSGLVVNFSFATSVITAYASGLPASTNITEASLEGAVNTVCRLSITGGGTPTGNTPGKIVKTGLGTSNSKGQAMVQFAVPACPTGTRECYLALGTKEYSTTLAKDDALSSATAYSAIALMEMSSIDLSSGETANCYIVSASDQYKFKATVKGNSTTSVGNPAKAEVLWESFGTSAKPNVGDLVEKVSLKDGYVRFKATANKGNAVIAVKDAGGTILWSWHIWLTDKPADQVYNNNAGTMMDRNLGATSATPGSVGALGLLYQWGRKDPFLGGDGISSSTEAASTLSWPSAEAASDHLSSNNTLDYSIKNPTVFLKSESTPFNWYCTNSTYQKNDLWGSTKTIYDPCPPGYRIPNGGDTSSGVWSKAFAKEIAWTSLSNWDSTNKGMDFSKTDYTLGSDTIWYPTSGYRRNSNGLFYELGSFGGYWSCTPSSTKVYDFYFNSSGRIGPSDSNGRAYGMSVRCLLIKK